MTEEEKKKQSGTVEYVPTYGQFAAAQNAGNAASNIASGIMPMTYARGGAYTPTAATPAVVKYNLDEPGGTTPETTPGTTPETTPTTKYADNVDGLTVRQMIEEQRKASYADAEKLRERSVIDASTAYAQNKATYGANAEALAGMGLTGGGYGDYLNSRAYAQQREEIQAARAGEAAAKREADKVYYADMMAQKEKEDAAAKAEADKSNAAFIDLLAQAKTGNYTAEDIKNMAAKAGITDTADIEALAGVATTAQSNIQSEKDTAAAEKKNAAYATLLDAAKSGAYTADEIKALAGKMGITNEADLTALGNAATDAQGDIESEKQKAESDRQSAAYIELLAEAKTGAFTADEIRSMAGALGITDETKLTNLATAASAAQTAISDKESASEADKQNAAYVELLAEAKKGTFTADEIRSMAGALGITDETKLSNLGNAATTAQSNIQGEKDVAATDKQNTTYANLLDMAMGGNFTEEVIRDLAKRMGLSDEDAEKLANAAKTTRESNERENISGNISADTTDEEIDKMVADGDLDKENVQAAKDVRTEAAAQKVTELYTGGNIAEADKLVEQYYKSGAYSTDERQNYYMEKTLDDIEYAAQNGDISAENVKTHEQALEKAKNEGKISQADYDAAKKYLYETVTTVVDSGNVNLKWKAGGIGYKNFDITINGETVKMASPSDKPVEKEISNVLDMVTNNSPSEGTFAIYDDGLYVYLDSHGHSGWYKASRNVFNEGIVSSLANKRIYDIIKNDIKPKTASPTRPEHKAVK